MAHSDVRQRPGSEPAWADVHDLFFLAPDASVAGYVTMTLLPNQGLSWFWAALVRPGQAAVLVVDQEAPLPRWPTWELRTDGLWCEIIVETPGEHVTVGMEAFGVAFDDPVEVFRRGYGDRTPIAFDLEWETDRGTARTGRSPELACRVHGEVLVGADQYDLDGRGHRARRSGVTDWTQPWTRVIGELKVDQRAALPAPSTASDGSAAVVAVIGHDLGLGDARRIEPLAWAPVPVPAAPPAAPFGKGRPEPGSAGSQLLRALVLTHGPGQAAAPAWLELNLPH